MMRTGPISQFVDRHFLHFNAAALKDAAPVIMRSAQKGVVHRNAASRKVSRLTLRVAKLAQ